MSREQAFDNSSEEPSWNNNQFNDKAFEVFFKKSFTMLCAHCQYKFGFNLAEAEELVQTAFIKLWENRQSISGNLSMEKYLYKVIYNKEFRHFKT